MIGKREEKRRPDAILIAGPTASGKSALAIALAQRFDGLVVNADSMQVYGDLRIITARPTPEEEEAAPHALYGTVDGARNHSVSLWAANLAAILEQAKRDALLPILVGGTGLYFKAVTQGLSPIPIVPADVREAVRAWGRDLAPQALHAELTRRDPETASRLRPTDPQRLLRALEVHEATGRPLAAFQARRDPPLLDMERCIAAVLVPERPALAAQIDRRFDAMIAHGALEEVAVLARRRLDPALPLMRAHGVPPLLAYLAGEWTLDAAIIEGKAATRRYVKRQETFTRNQLPAFRPLTPNEAEGQLARAIDQFV